MKKFLVILVLFLASLSAFCQQDQDTSFVPKYKKGIKYIFKTNNGLVFRGFVSNETRDFVTIQNRDVHETYELRKSEIIFSKIYSDRQSYTDLVLGENYHSRNYLVTQSAFLFREGKLSSTSHFLLLNNLDYAFSEHWAVTANTFAFFYPVSIGVKCAYAIDEMNYVGANIFGMGNLAASGSNSSLLFGYGFLAKFTRGTSNNNFTAMAGVIGLTSDLFVGVPSSSFVNFAFAGAAGCRRVSKNIALTGEALYFPSADFGLAGIGLKLIGNEYTCWTFGCFSFLSSYNNTIQLNLKTIPVPYFGLSRNF